jgi:alkylation response protein AidB-like acyl-CoA dehydrogenase
MWITNGAVSQVAIVGEGRRRIRGFVVPADAPGFGA